jgi:hypothetical protein
MKELKITPITAKQYDKVSGNEAKETVYYEGLIASKRVNHPEFGDVILISSFHGSCLMIHSRPHL